MIVDETNASPDRGPLGPATRSSIIVHILREHIRNRSKSPDAGHEGGE